MHRTLFQHHERRKETSMTTLPCVELFTRPDCHLCHEARAVLLDVQSSYAFILHEIDITTDPTLLARYGEEVPVVLVNGQKAGKYGVDRAYFIRVLRRSQHRVWRFFSRPSDG